LLDASWGYDLPRFVKFKDIKTWDEQGPPMGTLSHCPNEAGQQIIVPRAPAPSIAAQI